MKKREILFRAKSLDSDCWLYGLPCYDFQCKRISSIESNSLKVQRQGLWDIDPDTITEFIGSCDITGKQIFEGDIVEFHGSIFVIDFNQSRFVATALGIIYYNFFCFDKSTVVGNIFDNPELLKRFGKEGSKQWQR